MRRDRAAPLSTCIISSNPLCSAVIHDRLREGGNQMRPNQKGKSNPLSRGERKAIFVHLDPEAHAILECLAPGRCKGRFISLLLHEHETRRVTRAGVLAEVAAR